MSLSCGTARGSIASVMGRLKRSVDYYTAWMSVDGNGMSEEVINKRRNEADELLKSIKHGHFDADTLRELTQLLDHECYYLETIAYGNGSGKNPQRRGSIALDKPWTCMLVTDLSGCLFQSIYPESYYERELQFRALLSALVLQRAQGAEARQVDHYEELQTLFQKGHKDLQWQRGWSGDFTKERFRKYQCSFLLVAVAEYSKNFRREQPLIINVLSRVISLILSGGSLALAATSGLGAGNLQPLIQNFDNSFRPLCQSPEERADTVFALQEATRMALAADLCRKITKSLPGADRQRYKAPETLAAWILDSVLQLLSKEQIEESVSHPATVWNHLLAFLNRGPPCFGDYYYLYGLLDCATQLGRILERDTVPPAFEERMRRIIQKSKDPSLRWKAIEFLVLVGLWKDTDDPVTMDEAAVIKACLAEESSPLSPPRSLLRMRSQVESLETLSGPQEMDPQEWIEPEEDFPHFRISTEVEFAKIPPKHYSNKQYTAGISPNCKSVFFLSTKNIIVCSLDNFPNILEGGIRLNHKPASKLEYSAARATLTNRFLAVISGRSSKFSLFEHGASIEDGRLLYSESLHMWYPTCLAMHEARDRTWVAIGGRSGQVASIEMYVIEGVKGNLAVKRHDAQFGKWVPDLLSNDWLKMVDFSPDGRRLVCLTNDKNTVLVWFLSNNARPRQAAFEIMKPYEWGTTARGIESASLFYAPSGRSYVLCTTSPSTRRQQGGGEWPFVSPVNLGPGKPSELLEHSFSGLGATPPILAGAVSPYGNIVAMLEDTGNLILCSLVANDKGGLRPSAEPPVILKKKLSKHKNALMSTASLRFYHDEGSERLYLFAVDINGTVVRIDIETPGLAREGRERIFTQRGSVSTQQTKVAGPIIE